MRRQGSRSLFGPLLYLGLTMLATACMQTGRGVAKEQSPSQHSGSIPPSVILTSECEPENPTRIARGIQIGTVILAYQIDTEGNVLAATIKKTSGHPMLDLVALKSISHCRFVPANINGQPVIDWADVTYEFKLNERKSVGE